MKICINAKIIEGAWGGGNQAVKIIVEHLRRSGHTVVFSLRESDIDLILMIHPNRYLGVRNFGIDEIKSYLYCHPNTLLVHRINTCDERRGYGNENEIILDANKYADYTVFISSFIKNLYIHNGFNPERPHCVILNGANEKIFTPKNRAEWKPKGKLRIVTHHWSNAYTKGFDIYERLDLLLGTEPFCNLFEFLFIGNTPKGLCFKHTRVISPLADDELACQLKQNHIYLTASRNEPAGMHHIEGMRCGLPVLYLNSGALPEYCAPYGIEFNLINFEKKLLEIRKLYFELRQKALDCPYSGYWMASQYEKLFKELINLRRKNLVRKPSIIKLLKYRLVSEQFRKVYQYWELAKKAKNYLKNKK